VTAGEKTQLAINAGSSSVKCAIFTFEDRPQPIARETIEGAGASCAPSLLDWVDTHILDSSLAAIGHRIVHGGPRYSDPEPITAGFLETLTQLIPFAPNHIPDEIALIEAIGRWRPKVPQVACFDTAFHRDLPEVARRLPIPQAFDVQGVRRYGFHGLSYAFLVEELRQLAGPAAAAGKLILAHLGNGSSLAAVRDGHSVDTTMAFTPIGGVVMSTRSGDLDPGVVTYIAKSEGLMPDQLEDLFSHKAGLLGISNVTGDMRELLARASDPACGLAVAAYVYSIKKAIGALTAVLGGLDALVFSGGIGEHVPSVRAGICDGLELLGVQLDPSRNAANAPIISSSMGRVAVRVIPTDEELMIARATYGVLGSKLAI
jgi:acetate kinase